MTAFGCNEALVEPRDLTGYCDTSVASRKPGDIAFRLLFLKSLCRRSVEPPGQDYRRIVNFDLGKSQVARILHRLTKPFQ